MHQSNDDRRVGPSHKIASTLFRGTTFQEGLVSAVTGVRKGEERYGTHPSWMHHRQSSVPGKLSLHFRPRVLHLPYIQVIVCYRALLDFIYISQYPTHDDDTLQYLTDALEEFHANKHILVNLGIRDHFNVPKFHSMLHYEECIRNFGTTDNYNTEMFERFHIDYAKEAWRASNFRNELPQMTQWLSRQEKIAMFQSYISHYQSEEEREEEVEEAVDRRNQEVGPVTAKRPTAPSQTLSSIQTKHNCPSFSYHLRIFLNRFLTRGDSIPRTQLANAFLPFDKLDVWHSFKFSLDTLGNDVDGQEGRDSVRAQPSRGDASSGRFDVVVVTYTDDAETTGLHGAHSYVST